MGPWRDPLFTQREAGDRPFRLFVDTVRLGSDPDWRVFADLLHGLRHVECYTTAPADGFDRNVVVALDSADRERPVATTTHDAGTGWHTIHAGRHCYRRAGRDPEVDVRDLLIAAAGASVADVAATSEPDALNDDVLRSQGVMSIREAMAVFGLWQRWKGRPTIVSRFGPATTDAWSLYEMATRTALPAADKYVAGCMDAQRHGLSRVGDLAFSTLARLERALRARDEIHWIAWSPEEARSRTEVLYHLDTFLLLLGAALDTTARACFLLFTTGTSLANRNWRAVLRMKELRTAAPHVVAEAERPEVDGRRRLVSDLRNSIHEEPLSALTNGTDHRIEVEIPGHLSDQVVRAAEDAGGTARFGLMVDGLGSRLRPDRFVEELLSSLLRDIDRIMSAIALDHGFPAHGEQEEPPGRWFDPEAGACAALLLGVAEPRTGGALADPTTTPA